MRTRQRDCAAALSGGQRREEAQDRNNTAKRTGGRPEAQGNRVHRNACQPPPKYVAPRGWAAADDLERALAGWPR